MVDCQISALLRPLSDLRANPDKPVDPWLGTKHRCSVAARLAAQLVVNGI
jgi:hypothetical protein